MNPIGTKELKTERLTLRKLRETDAAELFEAGSLAATLDEAREIVTMMMQYNDDPMNFNWVLEFEGVAVGRVKAWEVNPMDDYAQLGYDIGEKYRSRGLMSEAIRAICEFLLGEAGFNRVYCTVSELNIPSCRVCEKAGMTLEGRMRKHYKAPEGGYADARIYGILASEI